MKKIINIFYYLNFLPSFSVFQSLANFYVSSRSLSLLIGFLISFFHFYENFSTLIFRQMASLNQRFSPLIGFDNITWLGADLGKSSECEMRLNYFSIFTSGFLLIFQYALLFTTLFYLNEIIKKKLYNE